MAHPPSSPNRPYHLQILWDWDGSTPPDPAKSVGEPTVAARMEEMIAITTSPPETTSEPSRAHFVGYFSSKWITEPSAPRGWTMIGYHTTEPRIY